jgi:uncharacterized coiled-coil DUF342 family protein
MSDTKAADAAPAGGGAEEKSASPAAAPAAARSAEEPVYPEMPAFVARPDKERHTQTLSLLDQEIKTLTEKRSKMQTSVRDAEAGGGDVREARAALMVKMRALTATAKALRKEKGALLDQRTALWDGQKKARERLKKMRDELGKYTDLAGIEASISRMHYEQSTGSMTLNEEKKMLAELAELNKMKGAVAVYAEMAAQEKKKGEGGRGISDLLSAKSAEVAAVSAKISEIKAELDVLDAKKDKKRGKVKPLRDALDKVRKEIDGKYTALKELRSNWKKDNDVYFDYMKKVKVIRAQIRKIDDEFYEAQRAEARRAREEEEAKLKPWLEEMALCDTLINYLKGMRPKAPEAESKKSSAPAGFVSKKQLALLEGGMSVGTSKSKKRGKKKKRMAKLAEAKASTDQPIRHDMKALGDFSYLAKHSKQPLQMPSSTGDIDATLESLEAIKAYYDVLPRAKKKKTVEKKKKKTSSAEKGEDAEEGGAEDEDEDGTVSVGEEMDTPYGKAKVNACRGDGVVVASLAWGELYIQA